MKNPFLLLSLLFILIGNTNAQTPGGVVNTDFQMWLKANVGVTVEATGKVSQWDDQSGNALNALQTNTLYQPSYTDASQFFNGNPSVDFPQTSLVGMLTSCNVPTNLYSIFVVYNSTSNSTSARRALQSTANNWLIGPHGNNTGFYAGNWVYTSTPNPTTIPAVYTATSNGNATLNGFLNLNGKLMSAAAGVTATASPQTIALGASGYYNEPIGGSIAEVIVFNRLVDANEKRQIESYLAIKYGVTLDQSTATNYYNSAGDVVWNAATNGIYKNNIFALANDNPSALDVQTSRSANSNLISLSNPLILADGDFMFLSDNGLLATPVTQGGLPGGATSASALAWNVSLTGSAGTADITINSALGKPILLIDNDNNGSFETAIAAASSAGSTHTFTAVTLNNNAKIKIGYAPVITPGAVASSPLLWLKASDGVTTAGSAVSQWDDQSGSGNDFTQEMASRPTLLNSSINFNPALNFNADFMTRPTGIFKNTTNANSNVYIVQRVTNSSGNVRIIEEPTTATEFAIYHPYAGTTYWRPGSTDVTMLFSSYTNNTLPNLYSFNASATTGQTLTGIRSAIVQNGLVKASNNTTVAFTGKGSQMTLGNATQNRDISELIMFNSPITAAENSRIISYLSVKYGITIDQTSPTNYVNAAGAITWNAATNGVYKNRIFGIGKDSATKLNQTISQSVLSNLVTVEKNAALANGEFLFISDDNASTVPVAEAGLPGGALYATPRKWNVSKVGTVGPVDISVTPTINQFPILLIDNDNNGSFETARTDFSVTPNSHTFSNVTLADQAKFKVGYVTLVSTLSTDITIQDISLPTLSVCSNEGDVVVKLNNLTGQPITNVSFRDSMPAGIYYVPGSITGPGVTFGSNVVGNATTGYNVVTFNIANLPASGSVIFTFKAKAGCSVSGTPGDIVNVYTAKWAAKITTPLTTPAYQILFPSLSTTVTPASVSPRCQTPFSRTITICNGGFGSLDEVTVTDVNGSSLTFLGSNKGTVGGIGTSNGTIVLTAADFANIGNMDGKFDLNECITITNTYKITGSATPIAGTITAKWGCGGNFCTNNTSNNVKNTTTIYGGANTSPTPSITRKVYPVTPVMDPTDFYDKTFYYKEVLKNNSAATALNVRFAPVYQGIFFIDNLSIKASKNGGPLYIPTIGLIDNALNYPSNGTPQRNMDYSGSYGAYMGNFTGYNKSNAYIIGVGNLEPGDSVVITWEANTVSPISRQHSGYYAGNTWGCGNFRELDGMRVGGGQDGYNWWSGAIGCPTSNFNNCNTGYTMQVYNGLSPNPVNLPSWGSNQIGNFRNFSWDITNYPNFSKCAFDDGDTLKLRLRADAMSLPFYTSRSKFYIKLKVTPGAKWDGQLSKTYAYLDNSNVKWYADKVVDSHLTDSTIYVYFKRANLPNNNFGATNMYNSGFTLYVNLINYCPGPLTRTLLMTKVYHIDTTKATAMVLETGPKLPQFTWVGNCRSNCTDGVTIDAHAQARANYDRPDNNADGVADPVGDLNFNVVYKDLITLGDTLRIHTRMIVRATINSNYPYFYMLNEFREGISPYTRGITVNNFTKKDFPRITITTKTNTVYTGVGTAEPVSSTNQFIANLSLQGAGGITIPGYTSYHDGDTVDLVQNVIYWKEHDENWNRLIVNTAHTPYLALVPNPTFAQQYRCDSTICNIKITDYKKYQTSTHNYQTFGSTASMLQIHGYSQLSPGSCGTVYFPGEVRSVITPTLVKVRFPAGGPWTFTNANFYYQNKLNGTNTCAHVINNQPIPASQYYWIADTLVFDLRQMANYYGFDLDDAQLRSLYYINVFTNRTMPSGCAADHANTGTVLNINTEFEVKPAVEKPLFKYSFNSDAMYLNTPNKGTSCVITFPGGTTTNVSTTNMFFDVKVSGDKDINNANAQYNNSWLAIPNTGNIIVTKVEILGGAQIFAAAGSDIYRIGVHPHNSGTGRTYRVYVTMTSCDNASMKVYYDRTPISGYPVNWASYACAGNAKSATYSFITSKGELQMNGILYSSPKDLCVDDTLQLNVVNAQPVVANSIKVAFSVPFATNIIPGTAQLRRGTGAWVSIADPVLTAGKYTWTMAPGDSLAGINLAPNNLMSYRIGFITSCGFYSGAQIKSYIDGNVGCGPVTTKSNAWPPGIVVKGLPALTYYSNIKGAASPITTCNNGDGFDFKLKLPITGISPTGLTDTTVVTLPPGFGYVSYNPAAAGSHNAPAGQPRVVLQPDGSTWIMFQVTPSIAPPDSIIFTFKYSETSQSNKCSTSPDNISEIRTYQSTGVFCATLPGFCSVNIPNSAIDTVYLSSTKPSLMATVQSAKFVVSTCAAPPCTIKDSVLIRGSITNNGSADLLPGSPVYMEVFLDKNQNGIIDAGDTQFPTYTNTSGIAMGGSLIFNYMEAATTGGNCTDCEGKNLLIRFSNQVGGSGTQCLCDSSKTQGFNTVASKGILCAGSATGRISFKPGVGTISDYVYSIDDGVTYDPLNIFENLPAGTYKLKMKKVSDNVITSFDDVVITDPPSQYFTTPVITNATCNGYNNGSIVISSVGGFGAKTYSIIPNIGTQSPSGTFTGLTAQPYLITVTDANGCQKDTLVRVTEPSPIFVNAVADQVICTSGASTAVTLGGNGTSYSWTNDNPSIGLAASGSGIIPSFTAINTGTTVQTATITMVPSTVTCIGSAKTFQIMVTPVPTVNSVANAVYCGDDFSTAINFSGTTGTVPGIIYKWTNNEPEINLGTEGEGNIASFQTANNTAATLVATITVTPWIGDCSGPSTSFTITVTPTPYVNVKPDLTICNGDASGIISFTGVGAMSWTNSNTAIGLAASGAGNISSFTATNTGLTPITSTIVVTPVFGPCTGQTKTFTITVNPVPNITSNPMTAGICTGSSFTVTPVNGTDGAIPTGTKYSWPLPVVTGGMTGDATGDLAANISGTLVNTTNSVQTATYTVTPSYSGCPGVPFTVIVTVNPKSTISAMALTVCSGDPFNIIPTDGVNGVVPAGTTYSWILPNVTGGMTGAASGTAQAGIAGTLTNATTSNQTATYLVTPSSGSCVGSPFLVVVTVKSKPVINNMTQTRCSGNVFGVSPISGVNGIVPASTLYSWPAPTVTGGLAGGVSATNESNIYGTLYNPTTVSQTAVYTVTPSANGCDGLPFTVTITMNPSAFVHDKSATICSGGSFTFTPVNNVGNDTIPVGTTYTWAAPTLPAGVTGYAAGTNAASISGTLTNNTSSVQTVVYNVAAITASPDNCPKAFTVTITVDPKPVIAAKTAAICYQGTFTVAPLDGAGGDIVPSGTTYSWPAPTLPAGVTGYAAGTNASDISGTLTNATSSVKVVVYNVTATPPVGVGACANTFTVTVTVNPRPVVANKTAIICSNGTFTVTPVDGTGGDVVPATTTYSWSAPTLPAGVTGYTAGTNAASVTGTLVNTTNTVQTVVYNVTATTAAPASCTNSFTVTITVNPKPAIAAKTATICGGSTFTVVPSNGGAEIVPAGTTYSWLAPTIPVAVTGYAAGTNATSITGTLTNTTNVDQTVIYNVTASTADGCTNTFTVTVTVKPKPDAGLDQTICTGTSTILTGIVNTGTWTAQPGNPTGATLGSTTAGAATVAFTSTTNGTFNFIYTVNGCTDTMSVIVTARPNAGLDQLGLCPGSNVTLTGTGPNTGTWAAQAGNPAGGSLSSTAAGIATVSYTNAAAGTYSFIYSSISGCSDTMLVTITGGVDFGDLPAPWPVATAKVISCTVAGVPQGSTGAVWAGAGVSHETVQAGNVGLDTYEDGLSYPAGALTAGTTYSFTVTMNSNITGKTVYYGLWIDWNDNGNFADDLDFGGNPAFYSGSGVTASPVLRSFNVIPPAAAAGTYKMRLIVADVPIIASGFDKNYDNGEVEDYGTIITLPITLVSFTAAPQGSVSKLVWIVSQEINVNHYEILFSADGRNFNTIGNIPATNSQNYSALHTSPVTGINYYRLKIVDNDGKITYSEIRIVNFGKQKGEITVFPNPAYDVLNIKFPENWQGKAAKIALINQLGQIVLEKSTATVSQVESMNVSNLAAGIYMLRIQNNEGDTEIRKVKIR